MVIAQWLAWPLAIKLVPGSNPGKGDNLLTSDEEGNLINSNLKNIIVWVYELTGQILSYFPPLFRLTKHSLSLRKASCNNPRPYLSNCILNDVHRCRTSFRKKQLYATLVLTILVYVLPGAKRLVKAPCDLWSKDANSILEFLHLLRPSKCPEIKLNNIYVTKSWGQLSMQISALQTGG